MVLTEFILTDGDDVFPGAGQDNSGDDLIFGLGGNDLMTPGDGNDTVYGGVGNDTLICWYNPGSKELFGGAGDDQLNGGEANGALFDDTLHGGAGNDLLISGEGLETLYGGSGNDRLTVAYTHNAQHYFGNQGDDDLWASYGDDRIFGGAGNDGLNCAGGNDHVFGGSGDDFVQFDASHRDVVAGGAGFDVAAISCYRLGPPNHPPPPVDVVADFTGPTWTMTLDGHAGPILTGFEAVTVNTGLSGNATLLGGAENDFFYSAGDSACLDGGGGDDTLYGFAKTETLFGGEGNDVLHGSRYNDLLFGGSGDDYIKGGTGADTMAGASGADVFVFDSLADSGVKTGLIDNINFFVVQTGRTGFADRIDLSLIDARPGTAADNAFHFIGTAEFTAVGQVRVVDAGSSAFIEINTMGENPAEMKICLVGFDAATLGAEDFIL